MAKLELPLRNSLVFAILILFGLLTSGCYAQTSSGQPNALIRSPEAGAEVPINEPLTVEVTATDPAELGLVRIELKANDVVVDTYEIEGDESRVTTELSFTPTEAGPLTLVAVAYQVEGLSGTSARTEIEVIE
jgi:hypothetical protein